MSLKLGLVKKMIVNREFLVPDYYKDFTCKGTDCRNTCCSGWKVTIPMDEYFVLHGLQCNHRIKERIDRAFRPVYRPTPERYAEIAHNYQGNCPLLMENGYCMLHAKCGEEVLPTVCKIYPRSPKSDYAYESSCSNSCERTLELLLDTDTPIQFEIRKLKFKMNPDSPTYSEEEQKFYLELRKACFQILGARSLSLARRIIRVGKLFKALDIDIKYDLHQITWNEIDEDGYDIEYGLNIMKKITEWYKENNATLAEYLIEVEAFYGNSDVKETYLDAVHHFNQIFPNHETIFEKLLINQMFFKQFPFQPKFKTFEDEFIGLAGLYVIIRYLVVPLMRRHHSKEDLIDILSRLFRVVSHSQFEYNIMILLKRENVQDIDSLSRLIAL